MCHHQVVRNMCYGVFEARHRYNAHQVLYQKDKCVELTKSARCANQSSQATRNLQQLRADTIPLSTAKFRDLMNLCDKQLIPSSHYRFFRGLPHEQIPFTIYNVICISFLSHRFMRSLICLVIYFICINIHCLLFVTLGRQFQT